MHAGAPKTWFTPNYNYLYFRYAIPPSSSDRFHEVFAKKHDLKNNPRLLYDITTMISPVELQREKVTILRTDQNPGELILTFGATYHAGFSHGMRLVSMRGLNCSEAVNIAPVQWLDEYGKAVE
jgi:JmjC domain, hydroxylase